MRNARPPFRIAALMTAVTLVTACASADDKAAEDSAAAAAAAAAAAPPPPESFTLASKDGSWSGDITPGGIVYRQRGRDSLVFEFKAPNVTGGIQEYESLMMAQDTVRITISLANATCTDNSGASYTHLAQLWVTGKQRGRQISEEKQGCANRK